VALVETLYAVRDWGVGELWRSEGVVVAHDFHFGGDAAHEAVSDTDVQAWPPLTHTNVRQAAMTDDLDRRRVARSTCGRIGTGSLNAALDRKRCLTPDVQTADPLVRRIRAFLAGEADDFADVVLGLGWATPFQRSLAQTLRAVPRGEVVSYGELAALAGRPGAARAAGAFCAANRFTFLVPCHRVVSAYGIGGYGSAGIQVKRRLLALEGVSL
jgi:O-6-methylguanine DNA methyltransferase